MHTPNKPNPRKINPTQKIPNITHCRQSVRQTTSKSKKGHRAHSARQKQNWSAERYALNAERDNGHTGSRASNARQNGNVKAEVERATGDATKRDRR